MPSAIVGIGKRRQSILKKGDSRNAASAVSGKDGNLLADDGKPKDKGENDMMDYYDNYRKQLRNADRKTLGEALLHWDAVHEKNCKAKRYDLQIFSANHLVCIREEIERRRKEEE